MEGNQIEKCYYGFSPLIEARATANNKTSKRNNGIGVICVQTKSSTEF